MNISISSKDDTCTLSVSGELDRDTIRSSNVFDLIAQNDQTYIEKSSTIVINMASVKRADTAGLAWLINVIRDLRAQGKSITISDIPQKLNALARLSNANELITTRETADDA